MSDDKKPEDDKKSQCPVNETWRHVLYIGGMLALRAGLGGAATVAEKTHKCPIRKWSRHAIYTGGLVALFTTMESTPKLTSGGEATETATDGGKKWYEDCSFNEWGKHAFYVASMMGIAALINARKKRITRLGEHGTSKIVLLL